MVKLQSHCQIGDVEDTLEVVLEQDLIPSNNGGAYLPLPHYLAHPTISGVGRGVPPRSCLSLPLFTPLRHLFNLAKLSLASAVDDSLPPAPDLQPLPDGIHTCTPHSHILFYLISFIYLPGCYALNPCGLPEHDLTLWNTLNDGLDVLFAQVSKSCMCVLYAGHSSQFF